MMNPNLGFRLRVLLLLSGILLPGWQTSHCLAAGYGSLAGVVSDNKGVPLMGATVMIIGPTAFATLEASQSVAHMVTDAHGRFTITHLVPGWYSLKVSSPTRLPAMRNGVRVEAGETVVATFVLTDTFAPIRFQVPANSVSSWGDDWKWVLRTSSTTRPILRYKQEEKRTARALPSSKAPKAADRIVGILPGSTPHDPLAQDFGMASVFAYRQALSLDSDVLVAGSFAPLGVDAGSLGAMISRNQIKGEPQQFGVIFHQFSFAPGAAGAVGPTSAGFPQARAMAATYSETRLLAPKITVTAGMDINYLNAIDSVLAAQPHVQLEYQATRQTVISAQVGSIQPEWSNTAADRLGMLNVFPQITERGGRLELEQVNHSEAAINHRIGRTGRVQAAAYHDAVRNSAVWGLGRANYSQAFAGNSLPNLAGGGVVINGGNYQSTGFRAIYARTFGSHVEMLGGVASGQALSAAGYTLNGPMSSAPVAFQQRQTRAYMAKITAEVPGSHTRLTTSYEWVPTDRVTVLDPAGLANLQIQPYLGVQIRQPIPTPNFLPVHIDAVAEFQNLLSQGMVITGQSGEKPMELSSGYHAVRGGFSVQF